MKTGAVAFVPGKAVLRILFIILLHNTVTGDFRNYRRGCDRHAFRIAPDNALNGTLHNELHSTVYDYIIGRDFEVCHSHLHGPEGRLVNIYAVDRFFVDYTDPDDRFFKYLFIGYFALLLRQLFRIV